MAFVSHQRLARVSAAVAHALAREHGVADHLLADAEAMPADHLSDLPYASTPAAKAWRWGAEPSAVADTLLEAGLPPDLAEAGERIMRRWEKDRDQYDLPGTRPSPGFTPHQAATAKLHEADLVAVGVGRCGRAGPGFASLPGGRGIHALTCHATGADTRRPGACFRPNERGDVSPLAQG
jgi:hypothetical protein